MGWWKCNNYRLILLFYWNRLFTLVVWTNSSQVTGSSSGKTHNVDALISCSTASILNSTKSFTLSIVSSRFTGEAKEREADSDSGQVGRHWKGGVERVKHRATEKSSLCKLLKTRENSHKQQVHTQLMLILSEAVSMWVIDLARYFTYPKPCQYGKCICLCS